MRGDWTGRETIQTVSENRMTTKATRERLRVENKDVVAMV